MHDVAIVGQGPAGGMAALRLAEAGRSVVAFERKARVGVPIHCGEGLGEIALTHVGMPVGDWVTRRVEGNRIIMPSGQWVGLMAPGFTIDRWAFDQSLSDAAVETGVERHQGTAVANVARAGDGPGDGWALRTRDGCEFHARQLIIAEGRVPRLVTQVGLAGNPRDTLLAGLQYKFRTADIDYPETPYLDFYIHPRFPDGYVWVFPRGDDISVGIVAAGDIKERLEWFCREKLGVDPKARIPQVSGARQNGGLIPRAGPIPRFAVAGAYVVGDAAGLTNPITKGGIHVGMLSGELAAVACRRALGDTAAATPDHVVREPRGEFAPHEWYDATLKRQPWTQAKFLKESKIIYALNERVLNLIGKIYDGKNYDRLPWLRMLGVLLRNPDLVFKAWQLLKIKKSLKITEQYGW